MYIHKEGFTIIAVSLLVSLCILVPLYLWQRNGSLPVWLWSILSALIVLTTVLIVLFFRMPNVELNYDEHHLMAPADGKVVIVDTVTEPEFFKDRRIQVSIFMSPLNVHVNRYPISGLVRFYRYHPGKYLVAWHPKSSTLNERTTVVIETADGRQILERQIAGAVARRIVCYAKEGQDVKQNDELGFIKFGSRVDLFLPIGTEVLVTPGDIVKSGRTKVARW